MNNQIVDLHHVPGDDSKVVVLVKDQPGSGGANHHYAVTNIDMHTNPEYSSYFGPPEQINILFQNGPIPQNGHNGVTLEQLLGICGHRLVGFQSGPFACDNNERALQHILQAISILNERTVDRIARGVEGKEVQ